MKNKVPFYGSEELPKHEIIVDSLHMHKRDVTPNLETKGNTHGFSIKFLVEKASTFNDANNWKAFNTVLALSIYGIILFPNIDNFIDMTTIFIFLTKNPISALLDDVLYFLNLMHEKRGIMVLCCASFLYI